MPRKSTLAALALTLLASGSVALGVRCLSPDVARCSWDSLTGRGPTLDVPYLGTRPQVVRAMLDMAAVRGGDRVLDLGTGDGRILIAAARRGASGTGIDIDPVLVREAQAAATAAGVEARTRFAAQDLFATRFAGHDVVTMFLLPRINRAIRPRLLRELTPGARIVSHAFDMGDWSPDADRHVSGARIYLWQVPAAVAGEWRLDDGRRLSLTQRFQGVGGSLDGEPITGGRLAGAAIRFGVGDRQYSGTVERDRMRGDGWRARRVTIGPPPDAGTPEGR